MTRNYNSFKAEDFEKLDKEKVSKMYTQQAFWKKIRSKSKYLSIKGVLFSFILYYFTVSDTASLKTKLSVYRQAYIALGYFIVPLDLIPDIPPLGFIDDIFLLSFVVKRFSSSAHDELKQNLTIEIIDKARRSTLELFPNCDEEIDSILKSEIPSFYD